MKKLAFSILFVSLLGAFVAAQDAATPAPAAPAPALKFSGYLETGIDADFSDSGTNTYFYSHTENPFVNGSTFKLVGTYDADTYGYKFRLRARPLDYNGKQFDAWQEAPSVNYVYGWYKPAPGVTVFAGKLADGTIGGLDDEGDIAVFYLEGAEVQYSANGFSVLAAAGKRNPSNGGNQIDGLLTAFAAQYSFPKAFTVEAHLTTGFDQWNAPVTYAGYDNSKVGGYAITASLDAVSNLTLTAGFNAYTVSSSPYNFLDVTAFYTLDKLTVGGKVYDHISSKYFSNPYYDITPSVAYAVTPALTLGAQVEIITDDQSKDLLWAGDQTPLGATSIPAVTATYVLGGATTTGYVGYDVNNKTTKTYLDFVFKF
jgi:hypothetical protein